MSIKTQIENEANIQLSLDRTSLVNKGFIIWHPAPSCRVVFYFCVCRFLSTFLFSLFLFSLMFWVFSFSSSIVTEKSQKIFRPPRKKFCERNLSCTRSDLVKFDYGNKTRSPQWAVSLNLALLGSQSQRGI